MTDRTPDFAAEGVFIDNAWHTCQSGEELPVIDPSRGERIGAVAAGGRADVEAAVAAARRAFESGPWARMPAVERGRLLGKLGRAVEDRHEELALLEAGDTGKPMRQAKADVVAIARYFEYYGAAADKLHGDAIPFLDGFFVSTVWEPKGVTAHIIPWNYPGQMFGRSVAPSLAVVNTTVVKPAEEALPRPAAPRRTRGGSRLSRGRG